MVGGLDLHGVEGALVNGVSGLGAERVGLAGGGVVIGVHRGLEGVGGDPHLVGQIGQGVGLQPVAGGDLLVQPAGGLGLDAFGVNDHPRGGLGQDGGAQLQIGGGGLVEEALALLIHQHEGLTAGGQIPAGAQDIGEGPDGAHVLEQHTVGLKDGHKVAGGAHHVGGLQDLVAGGVLGQQLLVAAEAAGGHDGLFGQDLVAFSVVGLHSYAGHSVPVPDEVHPLGADADVNAQLSGLLLHVVHNGLAGVDPPSHHMVAHAVGVVKLGAHLAEPSVGGEGLLGPDLDPLQGVAVVLVILDELLHRILLAGVGHGLGTV